MTTKHEGNDDKDNRMMPKMITAFATVGIRGLLTIVGFLALTIGYLNGNVSLDLYGSLVAMMVGFWFASKSSTNGK